MSVSEPEAKPPGRIERKRMAKIREILMATAQVLHRDGYHSMSLEEVADKVDLTKATLYHYFQGKDELVSACLELVGKEVNTRLTELAATTAEMSAEDSLRALLQEQLTILLLDYPEAARLFSQPLEWPVEHRQLVRTLREQHDAVFRAVIERGTKSGEFSPSDANVAIHCIYGALNYAPVWVRTTSRATTTRSITSMADTLMKMLR